MRKRFRIEREIRMAKMFKIWCWSTIVHTFLLKKPENGQNYYFWWFHWFVPRVVAPSGHLMTKELKFGHQRHQRHLWLLDPSATYQAHRKRLKKFSKTRNRFCTPKSTTLSITALQSDDKWGLQSQFCRFSSEIWTVKNQHFLKSVFPVLIISDYWYSLNL